MKRRLYSFVLILICVILAMPAFSSAEETHRYTVASVTKNVVLSATKTVDWTEEYFYEVKTETEKQPLIFDDTVEKPKTGFSYMTPEEIAQLSDEIKVVTTDSEGVVYETRYYENRLKKTLLEIEKIFGYQKQADGTMKKVLRVKSTKTKTPLTDLTLDIYAGEEKILYEQLAYIYYEYFGEHVVIYEYIDGTSFQKILEICRNADRYDRLFWIPNKSPEKAKADKAYILEALLNVTEEEFGMVQTLIMDQILDFAYVSKKGSEYTIRISPVKYTGKK